MNLAAEQLRILRHMLGIDLPAVKAPVPYRDYYCASRGEYLNGLLLSDYLGYHFVDPKDYILGCGLCQVGIPCQDKRP